MKEITKENDYRPGRREVGLITKISPSLSFYKRIFPTVWGAVCQAKIGQYDSEAWVGSSQNILESLEEVGCLIEVENLNSFRQLKEPCVFIGNHMSTLETFVLPGLIQPVMDVTFIVKKALVTYPYFKHVMISRDPLVVSRTNPREDLRHVLNEGERRLQDGISIIVFPQTTRAYHTRISRFNSIGVKLAKHAGVPVVPFALRTDAWANGRWVKDIGKIDPRYPVHIAFGDPLRVEGSGKEVHEQIVTFISKKLEGWFPEPASSSGSRI
jgi:1-acyl-sn-glycerol-3-phosphate acyltransferase